MPARDFDLSDRPVPFLKQTSGLLAVVSFELVSSEWNKSHRLRLRMPANDLSN